MTAPRRPRAATLAELEESADLLKEAVGEALAAARGERSLRDVATTLGTSHVHLVELEQGRANPTLERLARVGRAYGGHFEVAFVPDDA